MHLPRCGFSCVRVDSVIVGTQFGSPGVDKGCWASKSSVRSRGACRGAHGDASREPRQGPSSVLQANPREAPPRPQRPRLQHPALGKALLPQFLLPAGRRPCEVLQKVCMSVLTNSSWSLRVSYERERDRERSEGNRDRDRDRQRAQGGNDLVLLIR